MANRYELSEFGKLGEITIAQCLRQRGFVVEIVSQFSDYDLLIEGQVRAEVKSAFLSSGSNGNKGRWQFSLRRHGLMVDEDLLFLLCWESVDDPPLAVFIIPGDMLPATLTKIDISSPSPSEYRGKWARYRNNWSTVREVVASAPPGRQVSLFRQSTGSTIPF